MLANWKSDSYDSILVILDQLIKMIPYELVKDMINTPSLVEVIINVIACNHGVPESIIIDQDLLFISKF